jgi:protein tyrosine/serine phosphatase
MDAQRTDIFLFSDNNANFREIRLGSIAPGVLYRSSHPVPNGEQNREAVLLASQARIACVLNLAETVPALKKTAAACPWYRRLMNKGCAIALNMDFDFASGEFAEKLGRGVKFMLDHDGPYLIHCFAGFDRTGFMSMVLEALMGATVSEITKDYLLSYGSGFFSAVNDGSGDDAQVVLEQLQMMNLGEPVTDENLQAGAERYLMQKAGLTEAEIGVLKTKLSCSVIQF